VNPCVPNNPSAFLPSSLSDFAYLPITPGPERSIPA
jgi:hypothetical protein